MRGDRSLVVRDSNVARSRRAASRAAELIHRYARINAETMAETPATRTSLQRTPPPSLPYKLEIDQLKRRLALVAGGTDAAELTALLAAREDDVARLCQENAQLRQGAPPPPTPDSDAEAALELLEGELATEQAARGERAEHELAALRASSGDLESERAARERPSTSWRRCGRRRASSTRSGPRGRAPSGTGTAPRPSARRSGSRPRRRRRARGPGRAPRGRRGRRVERRGRRSATRWSRSATRPAARPRPSAARSRPRSGRTRSSRRSTAGA